MDVLRKIEGKYLRGRGGNSDVVDIPAGLVEDVVVVAEKPELQDNLLPEGGGGILSRELRPLDRVESRDVHFDYAWPGEALGGVEAALDATIEKATKAAEARALAEQAEAEAEQAAKEADEIVRQAEEAEARAEAAKLAKAKKQAARKKAQKKRRKQKMRDADDDDEKDKQEEGGAPL